MATFCGKCGARVGRPDQAFCLACGAQLVGGDATTGTPPQPPPSESEPHPDDPWGGFVESTIDPAGPNAWTPLATERPEGRTTIEGWEIGVIILLVVGWLGLTVWQVAPVLADLVRGDSVPSGHLIDAAVIVAIPPLAIVAFLAGRLAGWGGWRWAIPILVAAPILLFVTPDGMSIADTPSATKPTAGPTSKDTPSKSEPTPGPSATPAPSGPLGGLPVPTLPISIPKPPIPNIGDNPTPVPGTRLTAAQARDLVRESIKDCFVLRAQLAAAQVTFEAPNWIVSLPLSRGSWRVDDGTGTITPDAAATERVRACTESSDNAR